MVETSHPGNIGAVARAMKNMSMGNLYLVAPKSFPSAEATARASGADDLLSSAVVCESLLEAITDCQIVIGVSARSRTIEWPELTPQQCATQLKVAAQHNQVAIVFGRENSGLKNNELDYCRFLLKIPCNSEYSSLNLAAAVQIVCYELFIAAAEQATGLPEQETPEATAQQMELFYQHLSETLSAIGFMHQDKSKSVMRRLRRIYNRSRLDSKELDMLRGILRMSQGHNNSN